VRIEVSDKYSTVSTLIQQYLFIPAKYKEAYLAYVLNEFAGSTAIVFLATCSAAQKATAMLANLGFKAVCLHGQMPQPKRLAALARFKGGTKTVLLATDVAARGLDIPAVDVVLNYDVPSNGKDYIHRVGRTARAGRAGRAVTLVTQYDIELYQRIEGLLGRKLDAFPSVEEAAMLLVPRVAEASRLAGLEMRNGDGGDGDDGGGGGARKRRTDGGAGEGDDSEAATAAALLGESQNKRRAIGKFVTGRGGGGGGGRGRGRGRGGGRR
jgi:ATP-dependent RNA helicase DDX47/RRP3